MCGSLLKNLQPWHANPGLNTRNATAAGEPTSSLSCWLPLLKNSLAGRTWLVDRLPLPCFTQFQHCDCVDDTHPDAGAFLVA